VPCSLKEECLRTHSSSVGKCLSWVHASERFSSHKCAIIYFLFCCPFERTHLLSSRGTMHSRFLLMRSANHAAAFAKQRSCRVHSCHLRFCVFTVSEVGPIHSLGHACLLGPIHSHGHACLLGPIHSLGHACLLGPTHSLGHACLTDSAGALAATTSSSSRRGRRRSLRLSPQVWQSSRTRCLQI
jgi:hypothetical protein